MKIQFLNIAATYTELKQEIDAALNRVLEKGWFILGEEVEKFEQEFAAYCGAKYCCAVSNGLDALSLSLKAVGIKEGDEVIVPAHTFIATWLALTNVGAKVVPVDADKESFNINIALIENAITKNTKAIIPVHLYGQPALMDEINLIAEKHSIAVVEDAAQAHGAKYKNRIIGSFGNTTCFSFYPGKNLGAFGDGGAVVTNDEEIYKKIKILSNYGSSQKYVHEMKGSNCRLDEMQAAVLSVKLKYLDEWNERRKTIAELYLREINNPVIELPKISTFANHAWHLFVVKCKRREGLKNYLSQNGIGTVVHYPIPTYSQKAFENYQFKEEQFPVATQLGKEVLSIPIGPHLTTEEAGKVIEVINEFK